MTKLQEAFQFVLIGNKLTGVFVAEYKFCESRKWRADFCDIKNKICIELEGGIWAGGRHTRPLGYLKDTEKYNAMATLGYRLLRYASPQQIYSNFYDDYKKIINLHT